MPSLQGKLLVASPHLGDGNFFRSVVLLVKHDEEGAFGLILNRPLSNSLEEVWKAIADEFQLDEDVTSDQNIFLGGPVPGPLVAIHQLKKYSESQVLEGVHFAAHKDFLRKVIAGKQKPFRVFSGYSGWGAGQLEDELEAGGWLVAECDKDLIFYAGDDLWERVVHTIADQIMAPAMKTKHVPPDPSLN
jgi:putative transcriptional regulator